jgi:beta-galactosidase/beta-glucuronidase
MDIQSIASTSLDAEGRGYPRPQLRRESWISLNGRWDFAFDFDAAWRTPPDVVWMEQIRVPFSPEAPASGLGHTGFLRACWYRTTVDLETPPDGSRWLLHFGAVDYMATVWINGIPFRCHRLHQRRPMRDRRACRG